MYLSIIMPAFNEQDIIATNIMAVVAYLRENLAPGQKFEVIVVDDGSTDDTPSIVDRLDQENDCVVAAHHPRNLGRGRALRTGFGLSRGRYVVTLDSDLSYAPRHIKKMLKMMESGQADMVLCSAYHREGKVENVPWARAFVSRQGNRVLSLAVKGNLSTLTCMVRGYKKELIEALELNSDGKQIHLEILLKAQLLGYKIGEIPAHLKWASHKRTGGRRGFNVNRLSRTAYEHLVFNFLLRPSLLFMVPIILLSLIILIIVGVSFLSYLHTLGQQPAEMAWWLQVYHALRAHLIEARISYLVLAFCLLLLFQFISMSFLAKQTKHQFEELYILLSRIRADQKQDSGE